MSKVENANSKKYTYFDPETLSKKEVEVNVSFSPAESYAEAVKRFNSDEGKLLAALNAKLQRDAFTAARADVRGQGIPISVIMQFIKPYRESPDFKGIKTRTEQTDAILTQIKQIPLIMTALKAAAAEANDEGEGEEKED